jgi:hypothetical protein
MTKVHHQALNPWAPRQTPASDPICNTLLIKADQAEGIIECGQLLPQSNKVTKRACSPPANVICSLQALWHLNISMRLQQRKLHNKQQQQLIEA